MHSFIGNLSNSPTKNGMRKRDSITSGRRGGLLRPKLVSIRMAKDD
jgi:hypothetical protein